MAMCPPKRGDPQHPCSLGPCHTGWVSSPDWTYTPLLAQQSLGSVLSHVSPTGGQLDNHGLLWEPSCDKVTDHSR